MVKKLLRLFVVIVGFFIGPGITYAVFTALSSSQGSPANAGLELWAAILIYFITSLSVTQTLQNVSKYKKIVILTPILEIL